MEALRPEEGPGLPRATQKAWDRVGKKPGSCLPPEMLMVTKPPQAAFRWLAHPWRPSQETGEIGLWVHAMKPVYL